MKVWLLALSLLAQPAAAATLEPQPFAAEYEVWMDGKQAGISRIELQREADGQWLHEVRAEGTRGLAKWADFESTQRTHLQWDGAGLRLLSATMRTESLVSSRDCRVEFDWARRQLRWQGDVDREQTAPQPLQDDAATGSSLNLQLALAAADPALASAHFTVHERGKPSAVEYVRGSEEDIVVPLGRYRAVPMRRDRPEKRRTTIAWYAPGLPATPVRLLQREDGEDKYELRLRALRPD